MGKISEIFNFDNIGGKIKNLAKWSCWVTILLIWIAAPITFIVLVADDWTAYLCWIPLVGAIVGPFFVWINSWAMYAFGELVEDVHAMRNNEKNSTIEKNTENIALEAQEMELNNSPVSSKFNTIEEKWQSEVSQLSDEELQKRCGQWMEWSKAYRTFCRQELQKRGL